MTIRLSDESLPLYKRVYSGIVQMIADQRLRPGQMLPSEKLLEEAFGVSRITVRRALDELQREGLITRSKGKLAQVSEPFVAVARTRIDEDFVTMLDLVYGTTPEILHFAWLLPDEPLRVELDIQPNEPILRVDRIRRSGNRPMLHTIAHVPAFIGSRLDKELLENGSMLDILSRFGIKITQARQVMSAIPCCPTIAPLLNLEPGAAIFRIDRLLSDEKGRPVQKLMASFRGDSFSYHLNSSTTLDRPGVEIASSAVMANPSHAQIPA